MHRGMLICGALSRHRGIAALGDPPHNLLYPLRGATLSDRSIIQCCVEQVWVKHSGLPTNLLDIPDLKVDFLHLARDLRIFFESVCHQPPQFVSPGTTLLVEDSQKLTSVCPANLLDAISDLFLGDILLDFPENTGVRSFRFPPLLIDTIDFGVRTILCVAISESFLLNDGELFDSNRKGEMTLPDATQALLHSISMSPEDVHSMFTKIDTNLRGYITFVDIFKTHQSSIAMVLRNGLSSSPRNVGCSPSGAGRTDGTEQSSVKSRGEWCGPGVVGIGGLGKGRGDWSGAGEGGIGSLDVEGDVASKVLRQRLMRGLLAALFYAVPSGRSGSLGSRVNPSRQQGYRGG
uniref:Uncharacterized protein n=1 Tax=Timema monikensis TaxID=170555 RepID=A0A7R9EHK8_9NEOP|nr:unnamed protein product [Timema monikensis]